MAGWADDPELLATFRAEVEERLASLTAGLLQLETHPAPRQVVAALFRDAHTVKGSARMLGLTGVLQVAHRCEDLLGALRDGRLPVRRDLVDVLLAACDGIESALPGLGAAGSDPAVEAQLDDLAGLLERALAGDVVAVPPGAAAPAAPAAPACRSRDPHPHPPAADAGPASSAGPLRTDSVRVATGKVYDLLDVVGEAELDARRVERASGTLDTLRGGPRPLAARAARRGRLPSVDPERPGRPDQARRRWASSSVPRRAACASSSTTRTAGSPQVRDGAMGLAMVPVRPGGGRPAACRPRRRHGHRQGRRVSSSWARTSSSTSRSSTASPTR